MEHLLSHKRMLVINMWVKQRSRRQRRKIWAQICASLTLTQWPSSLPSEAGWDTSCRNKNTSKEGVCACVPGKSRVARGAPSWSSWWWKWKSVCMNTLCLTLSCPMTCKTCRWQTEHFLRNPGHQKKNKKNKTYWSWHCQHSFVFPEMLIF